MKITVLQGQSLFDLAIQASGTPEAAFDLAMANGLSITDELTAGSPLNPPQGGLENKAISAYYAQRGIFPATDLTQKSIIIAAATDTWVRSVGTVRELSAINTVTALAQQSIIDLAIQELGSADAAFELAIANGLSLTDMPEPGKKVQMMRASSLQNKRIAAYFLQRGLKPATGLTETTEDNGIFDFTFDFTFN